jgi:hypothetical protein
VFLSRIPAENEPVNGGTTQGMDAAPKAAWMQREKQQRLLRASRAR